VERVLRHFEGACPDDDRPRRAVRAGREWVRGSIALHEAHAAPVAAHSAARTAADPSARSAARAAGHAAATAHVVGHARHAASYALASVADAVGSAEAAAAEELDWQRRGLPGHLRPIAFPGRADVPRAHPRRWFGGWDGLLQR